MVVVGDTSPGHRRSRCSTLVAGLGAHRRPRERRRRGLVRRSTVRPQLATWCADLLGDERLATANAWPLTSSWGRGHRTGSRLPFDAGFRRIRSTRASRRRTTARGLLGPVDADMLLCGHTHMQYDRTLSAGLRVVNPGSVGMPYEGQGAGHIWACSARRVEFRRSGVRRRGCSRRDRGSGAPDIERVRSSICSSRRDSVATTEYFEVAACHVATSARRGAASVDAASG